MLIGRHVIKWNSYRFIHLHIKSCLTIILTRNYGNTSKQIKQFYLAVHPDLFHEFPDEKEVNEQSLKLLHSHLQGIESGIPLHSASLTFYRKSDEEDSCFPVRLKLSSASKINLYQQILNAFDIPYDDSGSSDELDTCNSDLEILSNLAEMNLGNFQKKIIVPSLNEWLSENLESAKIARELSEKQRQCLLSTMKMLKDKLGIRQVIHNFKFTYSSLNNLLCLFEQIALAERRSKGSLENRSLILGNFTGLDNFGRFVIDFFEPPELWKQGLQELPQATRAFQSLQDVRKQLQNQCFGLHIGASRLSSPTTPVIPFLKGLLYILHNFEGDDFKVDFKCKGIYAILAWDDDFLSITNEGYVMLPLNTRKEVIHNFLSRNEEMIKKKRRDHLKKLYEEQKYLKTTKTKLKLSTLQKDPILKTEEFQTACERIIESNDTLGIEGCDVIISNYYSISANGFLRIPWNFLE